MLGTGLGARNVLVNKKQLCFHRVRKGGTELPHITVIQCDRDFKPDTCKAQVKYEGIGEGNQGGLPGRRGDALAGSCDMDRSLPSSWRVESILKGGHSREREWSVQSHRSRDSWIMMVELTWGRSY